MKKSYLFVLFLIVGLGLFLINPKKASAFECGSNSQTPASGYINSFASGALAPQYLRNCIQWTFDNQNFTKWIVGGVWVVGYPSSGNGSINMDTVNYQVSLAAGVIIESGYYPSSYPTRRADNVEITMTQVINSTNGQSNVFSNGIPKTWNIGDNLTPASSRGFQSSGVFSVDPNKLNNGTNNIQIRYSARATLYNSSGGAYTSTWSGELQFNFYKPAPQAQNNLLQVRSNPSGVTITNTDTGAVATTPHDVGPTTSTITKNYSVPATFSSGGTNYNFSNWTGCDSASGRNCYATVSGGATQTITANYIVAPTPVPGPPNLSFICSGSNVSFTINNIDTSPGGNKSVDIDNDNFAGGWWTKSIGTAASTTGPVGFSGYNGQSQDLQQYLNSNAGTSMEVRVWYENTSSYSQTGSGVVRNCYNPPTIDAQGANCSYIWARANNPNTSYYKATLWVDGLETNQAYDVLNSDAVGAIFDLRNWKDFGSHTFKIRILDPVSNKFIDSTPQTRGPCLQPKCDNFNTTPSDPVPGEPFSATVSFKIIDDTGADSSIGSKGSGASYTIYLKIDGTNRLSTEQAIGSGSVGPGDNSIQATTPVTGRDITYNSAGSHAITSRAIIGPTSVVCPSPNDVGNKPFFQVNGGDLVAGITSDCSGWTGSGAFNDAKIMAFNRGISPWSGAGAQLAAQAAATIDGLVSSYKNGGPPKKLSFANQADPYGGSFGNSPCPSDYYGTAINGNGGNPTNLPGSDLVSIVGSTLPLNTNRTVIINGNLTISADVIYAPWTTLANMPSLYVIVKGNIYIQPGVRQLDGVYIAQPKDPLPNNSSVATPNNGGYIYTCSNVAGNDKPLDSDLTDTASPKCYTSLKVNGSFIAMGIKLYRTAGNISDINSAAELIQFTPEVWLPRCQQFLCTNTNNYDSIQGLPPVL